MTIARDIEEARAVLESSERKSNPTLEAHALEEAIELLDSCAAEDISPSERTLIANLPVSHTRRLLTRLVTLESVSTDV